MIFSLLILQSKSCWLFWKFWLNWFAYILIEFGLNYSKFKIRVIWFMFEQATFYSLLTPWCRVLLEKLTALQLVKKFPGFHETLRFITALTSVRHLSPIQSIYPHPTSWRSVLILSTHLRLGLPSGLLPSGPPTQTLTFSTSKLRENLFLYTHSIQGVPGGMCQTSGECSLC